MKRIIVYVMRDGREEEFVLFSLEEEQHERAHAEREIRSRGTYVLDYYFKWAG